MYLKLGLAILKGAAYSMFNQPGKKCNYLKEAFMELFRLIIKDLYNY